MKKRRIWILGPLFVIFNLAFIQCSPLRSVPVGQNKLLEGVTPTPTSGGGVIPSPTSRPTPSPTPPTAPTGANYFPTGNIWASDISDPVAHPKDADSDAVIANLSARGGWGTGKIRMDTSINVLVADAATPRRQFTQSSTPDGDDAPLFGGVRSVPIPVGGNLEGETGYRCTTGGDCHLIVWDKSANKLYESWATDSAANVFTAAILVIWDLTKNYPVGRGNGCSSSDAAGFPIAPLLFTADEVAAGSINHAIRFILPNDRWRNSEFVHPATHSGGGTNGNSGGVFYGSRFRLKASKDISGLSAPAQVVARAMKKHGMFAADGGVIALTGMSDVNTTHKWSEFPQPTDNRYAPIDLSSLLVTDFEIVNDGRGKGSGYDCARVFP